MSTDAKLALEKTVRKLRIQLLQERSADDALRLLNAHFGLRLMEANGLHPPTLSAGLSPEQLAKALPPVLKKLSLTFDLFADCAASHRELTLLLQLGSAALNSCWHDDMTLGWVHHFWNDPVREANTSRNIPPEELAAQTQLFTERYMVKWLLQNSLGHCWLAICANHGWTASAEQTGALAALDAQRRSWRERWKTQHSTEQLQAESAIEQHWLYYVPRPVTALDQSSAPTSIRELKLLDPACGTGHFLVLAFDLLMELHREEAEHRGDRQHWTDAVIASHILERNLHGIDIDPQAVRIAATTLLLKARGFDPECTPRSLNLAATTLKLDIELCSKELAQELLLQETKVRPLFEQLVQFPHLGTLLKWQQHLDECASQPLNQLQLFSVEPSAEPSQALRAVLARHSTADDLGLQLSALPRLGPRLMALNQEGTYDIVIGNPPYLNKRKMSHKAYFETHYPAGKADLYACFLMRGLQLCRPGGRSAMITMRGWMFLESYLGIRRSFAKNHQLELLGDVHSGGFAFSKGGNINTHAMSINRRDAVGETLIVQPKSLHRISGEHLLEETRAGLQGQRQLFRRSLSAFESFAGQPFCYWWSDEQLGWLSNLPTIRDRATVAQGLGTGNNQRFLRKPHECPTAEIGRAWQPYIKGSRDKQWFEPLEDVIWWDKGGLSKRLTSEHWGTKGGNGCPSRHLYFTKGVAYKKIGPEDTCA